MMRIYKVLMWVKKIQCVKNNEKKTINLDNENANIYWFLSLLINGN